MGEPQPDRYVHALIGDRAKWDEWKEICRVNPLTKISPEFREKLKLERAEARRDSRLKARFLSYRLNVPTADEATTLLTTGNKRSTGTLRHGVGGQSSESTLARAARGRQLSPFGKQVVVKLWQLRQAFPQLPIRRNATASRLVCIKS